MLVEYTCADEGFCDTHCPNTDCIHHKNNVKGDLQK